MLIINDVGNKRYWFSKRHPFITRILIFLFLPALIIVFFLFFYLEESVLIYHGVESIPGLQNEVEVRFNDLGIPLVITESDEDIFFSQGFLHASERMWQMDYKRRLTQGKLSEWFGESHLDSDKWFRTLGLEKSADLAYLQLSTPAKNALNAYSRGVNAYIKRINKLPPEYIYLNVSQLDEWKPRDSLLIHKLLALSLSGNMYDELQRVNALKYITPAELRLFYPYDTKSIESKDLIGTQEDVVLSVSELKQMLHRERYMGSNAWAVSGAYTESGNAMLANDPHLGIEVPSPWYAIELKSARLHSKGFSLVGLPGVIVGRNRDIAWGITSLLADQQDLFVLDISTQNRHEFHTESGPKPIFERKEIIKVRTPWQKAALDNFQDVVYTVRETELGPIVSDLLPGRNKDLALKWTGLDANDTSFEAFHNLQYATNWQTFRQALSKLATPGLNFVYADTKGKIGQQAAGWIPVRQGESGIIPQNAFRDINRWQKYQVFSRNPSEFDPASGFISSANQQLSGQTTEIISHEWAPDFRFRRIEALLKEKIAAREPVSLLLMREMQSDRKDLSSVKLISYLLETVERGEKLTDKSGSLTQPALDLLKVWDNNYDAQSAGASVYHYWFEQLKSLLVANLAPTYELSEEKRVILSSLFELADGDTLFELLRSRETQTSCVGSGTPTCHRLLVQSFEMAVERLEKHSGSKKSQDWQWGAFHQVDYSHPLFSTNKLLSTLLSDKRPSAGSTNTLDVANAIPLDEGGYKQTLAASFRLVMSMQNFDDFIQVMPTGQSGHMLSKHFNDMKTIYSEPKLFNEVNVSTGSDIQQSRRVLVLKPELN